MLDILVYVCNASAKKVKSGRSLEFGKFQVNEKLCFQKKDE